MSTSQIDNLMNQADTAAEEFKAPATITPTPGTAVASYSKPSLDAMMDSGGMTVDTYVRLKAEGFRLGDDMQGLLEELTVSIDMTEIAPIKSARFETGGQTKFLKSYDGVTTPDGQNFAQAVRHEESRNQKASGVYDTAEIPFTLIEDVADPKKGGKTFEAGLRVGYTPSITGAKPFFAFLRKLRAQNPALLQETLTVKLVHEKKVNSNKNEWGVLNFELVEA